MCEDVVHQGARLVALGHLHGAHEHQSVQGKAIGTAAGCAAIEEIPHVKNDAKQMSDGNRGQNALTTKGNAAHGGREALEALFETVLEVPGTEPQFKGWHLAG